MKKKLVFLLILSFTIQGIGILCPARADVFEGARRGIAVSHDVFYSSYIAVFTNISVQMVTGKSKAPAPLQHKPVKQNNNDNSESDSICYLSSSNIKVRSNWLASYFCHAPHHAGNCVINTEALAYLKEQCALINILFPMMIYSLPRGAIDSYISTVFYRNV